MNYSLLIQLLAFFGAVQLSSKFSTKPLTNSIIAALLPFGVDLFLKCIYQVPLLSFSSLLIVGLQFGAALFIFHQLQHKDSYTEWFAWTIGGGITVIFIIPFVIGSITII